MRVILDEGVLSRSYVVTGGGRGVGRAIVERLVADGGAVVTVELDPATLAWVDAHPARSRVASVVGSAADEAVAGQAADRAQELGQLTGWVNNAAIFRDAGLDTASASENFELIELNLAPAVVGCATAVRVKTKLTAMDGLSSVEVGRVVERRAPSQAPLDRLGAAVGVVEELRNVGDEVLDRFVAEARAANHSWAEVGAVLGISKQAAQQRFPTGRALRRWRDGASDTLGAVMAVAEDEARAMGHNYLGTEHLLLGLVAQTDDLAADVLTELGVSREGILARTREIVGTSAPRRWEALGVTPRAKRVLELAQAETGRLGHRCMGTEHLLLGIARLDEGVAARLLRDAGALPARVREEVATRLGVDVDQLATPPRRRARLLRGR